VSDRREVSLVSVVAIGSTVDGIREPMSESLEELELRVGEKWATAAATREPQWETVEVDLSAWLGEIPIPDNAWEMSTVGQPLPPLLPDTPQFPREQWASYPAKRTVALLIADRLLDFDELTDEQWMTLCFLMQHGGKTRLV
jgi:hypothetical protein